MKLDNSENFHKKLKSPKIKYAYMVTREIEDGGPGYPVPNLGLHSSVKKAKKHYDSIITGRSKNDNFKLHWQGMILDTHTQNGDAIYKAMMEYSYGQYHVSEILMIERWLLK